MFEVIVGLKEGIACKELHQDTSNAPDVAREAPSQIQNDFGRPIMPGRNNGRMILVIERRRAKVNESDFAVQKDTTLTCVTGIRVRGGGDGAIVGESLIGTANEKNVFGLEVGVNEIQVM